MTRPVRFVFGVHLHQPVGNFGCVFQQHLDEAYQPFLDRFVAKSERGFDRTRQGECLTFSWPARLGQASLRLDTRIP